jgi:iron complex outermembrane receptor protein
MNYTTHQLRTADLFRRALLVGLGAQLIAPVALGQADAPVELEKMVVTGSLIPTSDSISPTQLYQEARLEQSGTQDVLAALKKIDPSFGGNGNVGQTENNGGGGEANIAVRNLSTLVLLNGRRLAGSAFSNGAAVDVNTIPLSMIERIEVLKDGASVLYGSEAIGGVVNIILKKNYAGVEVGGRYGFTSRNDDYSERSAYIVGGTSTEKTSFIAGAQYFQSEPLLTKARPGGSQGIASAIANDMSPPTYISPSFPGRVQSGGVSYILAGSPFAVGAPGYNAAITAPPSVKNPTVAGISYVPGTYSSVPAYLAAHPGVYIPISSTPAGQQLATAFGDAATAELAGWPLINTAQLNTYAIQTQDRRQASASVSHQIFGEQMEMFGEFLFSSTSSQGSLAPAPMSSLGIASITIAGSAPVNPFGIDLGINGAGSPRVRSRFIDIGNRLYDTEKDYYRFVGGLKGEFDNGYSYEVGYNYNRDNQTQYLRNSPNGAALQLATQANSDPGKAAAGLSQLLDPAGPVPLFDPFGLPGGNDPRTIRALRATGFQTGFSELWGVDGVLRGGLFDLPGGQVQFAAGGMFYTEALEVLYDPLTEAGQLIGQNPSLSSPKNRRDATSGFVETRLPLTSPENDVPGLYALEITAAGRVEQFDPGGSSAVPKVGAIWKPVDGQFALRGGYSQSFLAPTVFNLFGAPVNSADSVTAGGLGQVTMNWTSNPNLRPADAENWNIGGMFASKFLKGLSVSVDYYHIKTSSDVFRVGPQAVADSLNQFGSASEFASSFRFDDGSALTTTAPNQVTVANWGSADRPLRNGGQQMTDGIDITVNYDIPTESAGKFAVFASANVLLNYEYGDPLIGGPYQYAGQYTDDNAVSGAQGTLPDFVLNTGLTWTYRGFTFAANAQFIPEVDDLGDMHASAGSTSNSYTVSGNPWTIESFYTVDLQIGYEFGSGRSDKRWYDGTRLVFGCRNVTDNISPLIASSSEDFADKSTYDILGRFFYFEIAKKF